MMMKKKTTQTKPTINSACFPNSWQNLFVQLFFGLCLRHFSSRCHLLRPLENSFRYMLFQSTLVKFISSLKSCVRLIPFIFCETSFYQLDFDIHGELWVKIKKNDWCGMKERYTIFVFYLHNRRTTSNKMNKKYSKIKWNNARKWHERTQRSFRWTCSERRCICLHHSFILLISVWNLRELDFLSLSLLF